jgi:hypothetical protein
VFGVYIVVVVLVFFVVGTGVLAVRTYVRAAIVCLVVLYERVRLLYCIIFLFVVYLFDRVYDYTHFVFARIV